MAGTSEPYRATPVDVATGTPTARGIVTRKVNGQASALGSRESPRRSPAVGWLDVTAFSGPFGPGFTFARTC